MDRGSPIARVTRTLLVALGLGCAHHEPRLPPPVNEEEQRAADTLSQQRDYFEEYHTTSLRDCARRCTLAHAVCAKATRVCEIAEGYVRDENLAAYCQVASERCERVDRRTQTECRCHSTGPRVD
jgi:hypothetical protein